MNKELGEIITGFKRALLLLDKKERSTLFFASLIMVVTGILTNLPAVILGKLVDQIINKGHSQFSIALPFIIAIIAALLIREILTVLRKYLVENVATQTEKKQTVSTINHLLKTDITNIRKQQIGSLHGKIFRSIQGLISIIKLSFLDFFPVFFSALAAIVIALSQKPLIAFLMILVIPVGLFIVMIQISSQKGIRLALLKGKEKIDGTVVEMLGGIETVRALDTTTHEVKKVETITEQLRLKEIKHHIAMALFDSAKYLNEGFFYILVISISILLSAQGTISKGDILVYSVLFLSITAPLREIHRILDQAHEGSINVNNLYELIHQPLDVSFNSVNHASLDESPMKNIIMIKNLSFSYQRNSSLSILKNINLNILKGEKIGIAGPSGCGKSTLVKILLRLIHDYKGTVLVLNKNLQQLTRQEIAEKIAYIPQSPYVFSGTIKENILYGFNNKNVHQEDIVNATKKANIYEEIIHSLGGFEGKVSENGGNLSGGQKQRLVLARLILNKPEILIFDEATSALDNNNEMIVQNSIENIFKDKTIITIAHRLTTLKNSDRILVFDNGEIVQEGTYRELENKKGLFQDFLKIIPA